MTSLEIEVFLTVQKTGSGPWSGSWAALSLPGALDLRNFLINSGTSFEVPLQLAYIRDFNCRIKTFAME